MKDIYELLREKELEISRLETEVEALRVAAPLLSDDTEVGNDNKPTSARSTARSQRIQVSQAMNANPRPAQAAESEDRAQGWPLSSLLASLR
jgi:hypothetical protein